LEVERLASAHRAASQAVSLPGLTRQSIRSLGAEQSYDLRLLHALMDPRVKRGG